MSDQDQNFLRKLLQEHDLIPDKWVPLFHNEGIATKAHIAANKGSKELFESLSTEADTENEKIGLRNLLEISETTHNPESEIERKLGDAGLEPTCWLPVFKTQLGVRTPQGLQYIGSESYEDLKRFACKAWERKALRKFLEMEGEETSMKLLREKQKEKLQQRTHKLQQVLEELKDHKKHYLDTNTSQLMDDVLEALQVPECTCVFKDNSLELLINRLKANIDQLHGELMTNVDLNDVDILKHASCGRALQGVLVSKNLEDQFEVRENLLSAPQDAQFVAPSLCQDDKVEEFSSQYQEHQFTMSMCRLGYSATASAKAAFGFQMCTSHSKATEKERTSKHHRKEMYYCTIKYLFVPMASFHFKGRQLQLSADALRDLKAIEAFCGSKTALQEHCEQFFYKYGSHVNKGQLHFGGIYLLKCFSYGFRKSDLAEVKRLQSQAVSLSLGLSYESFGASFEGNVSNLKANFNGEFSEALMSKTTVEMTKYGGPQAASNIPLWKSGLVASNSTWSVIDCGSHTVPVWEIIQVQYLNAYFKLFRLCCKINGSHDLYTYILFFFNYPQYS